MKYYKKYAARFNIAYRADQQRNLSVVTFGLVALPDPSERLFNDFVKWRLLPMRPSILLRITIRCLRLLANLCCKKVLAIGS